MESETKWKGNISTALDCFSLMLVFEKLQINVMGITWALRVLFMKTLLKLKSC